MFHPEEIQLMAIKTQVKIANGIKKNNRLWNRSCSFK